MVFLRFRNYRITPSRDIERVSAEAATFMTLSWKWASQGICSPLKGCLADLANWGKRQAFPFRYLYCHFRNCHAAVEDKDLPNILESWFQVSTRVRTADTNYFRATANMSIHPRGRLSRKLCTATAFSKFQNAYRRASQMPWRSVRSCQSTQTLTLTPNKMVGTDNHPIQ